MTSTTHAKVSTTWNNSLRRLFQYFHQLFACKVALLLRQADTDALAWQSKRNEDRAAIIETSHRVATVGKCGEDNFLFHKMIGRPVGSPRCYCRRNSSIALSNSSISSI